MTALVQMLRNRLGEFWFYSLVLFVACRAADVVNAVVGIWVVPRYVSAAELGAVVPLTAFAATLALPASVFATTFMKELNSLALRERFGEMKTLIRGVFLGTGGFLLVAMAVMHFALPAFLTRIRVVRGSLGALILVAGFLGAAAPVYVNALQALKKFKAISLTQILGAPLRLAVMLVAMPFRALSGYFLGQAAPYVLHVAVAVVALRRELAVPARPYWSRAVAKRLYRTFLLVLSCQLSLGVAGLVEATVLRQRLPDVESAAYYLISRFSDVAGFLMMTLAVTLFPFTAELAERGRSTRPLMLKAIGAVLASNALFALFAFCFGERLLALMPGGASYAPYAWALAWMIALTTLGAVATLYVTTEISASRFGFLAWWVPVNLAYPALLLLTTGYRYFLAWLPTGLADFLAEHNVTSLGAYLGWASAAAFARALFVGIDVWRQGRSGR